VLALLPALFRKNVTRSLFSFGPLKDYVVARDDHDSNVPAKTFRTRTFLVGNLDRFATDGGTSSAPGSGHGVPSDSNQKQVDGAPRNVPSHKKIDSVDFGVDDAWSADVDVIEVDLGGSKKGKRSSTQYDI
jgi:hypothetical protein